jgi:uncharacterized protein (DUF488 family)
MTLYTIGHGTATQQRFVALLAGAGIERIVDVRTAPGSRRHPHFDRDAMSEWLPAAGVAYRWEPRLGGWRKPVAGSPNSALRGRSFQGYADHMRTPEFAAALDDVLEDAAARSTACMCAESVWWRCHRRMIADAALVGRGALVLHLFHDGRLAAHEPSPEARIDNDRLLVYDRGQTQL